jgi:hypothetical protein
MANKTLNKFEVMGGGRKLVIDNDTVERWNRCFPPPRQSAITRVQQTGIKRRSQNLNLLYMFSFAISPLSYLQVPAQARRNVLQRGTCGRGKEINRLFLKDTRTHNDWTDEEHMCPTIPGQRKHSDRFVILEPVAREEQ